MIKKLITAVAISIFYPLPCTAQQYPFICNDIKIDSNAYAMDKSGAPFTGSLECTFKWSKDTTYFFHYVNGYKEGVNIIYRKNHYIINGKEQDGSTENQITYEHGVAKKSCYIRDEPWQKQKQTPNCHIIDCGVEDCR